MITMQYEITLPSDYDMTIIERRVRDRGHMTDTSMGLALKAYLVRTREPGGSPVNQYAPFYLWRTANGMQTFLCGPGFAGLCASFGRPRVASAVGLSFVAGMAHGEPPRFATRTVSSVPSDRALEAELARLGERTARAAECAELHTFASALDPSTWTVVTLALWRAEPAFRECGVEHTDYRVLHVSMPEYDQLREAR